MIEMAGTTTQTCQCPRFYVEHFIALVASIGYFIYFFLFRGKLTASYLGKNLGFEFLALLVPGLRSMEAHAHHVFGTIRSKSVALDTKLEELRKLKALIKHNAVPESAAAVSFEIIRAAIDSPQLAILGFSMLTHLVKRYVIQNLQMPLCIQAKATYPLLIRALGSAKDSIRSCAIKAFVELWAIFPGDVEEVIRDKALTTTNARTKTSAMHWITSMNKERELPFKSFVPRILDCVKDADAAVKHAAISAIVQLFSNAPESAKEDLKKQVVQKYIQREATAQIYSGLGLELPEEIVHKNALTVDRSTSGLSRDQPSSGVSTEIGQHWDPIPIFNYEYLQDMFRNMEPWFEGKESEANWAKREFHVIEIRRLCKGNAPEHYTAIFLAGIKSLLDGLLKTVNSLRTTLSNNGCLLIADLAKAFGPGLDPMVEILMQNLIKLCGATKTITAENGNHTVQAILSHVTFNNRLLQHIWNACQDKNSRPRQFATIWLNIIISKNGHNMNIFEHGSGIDLIEKCLKRGLSDANPQVRESMRATFWTYWRNDKTRSSNIMNAMDPKHQELLLKHSANPNPAEFSDVALLTTSDDKKPNIARNLTKAVSKPSLKETMLAQKRAKQAASAGLERPNSPLPTAGSLNSAPVRPIRPAKKEISRPGTADPTQPRKPLKIDTKLASPRAPSLKPRPKSSLAISRSASKPSTAKTPTTKADSAINKSELKPIISTELSMPNPADSTATIPATPNSASKANIKQTISKANPVDIEYKFSPLIFRELTPLPVWSASIPATPSSASMANIKQPRIKPEPINIEHMTSTVETTELSLLVQPVSSQMTAEEPSTKDTLLTTDPAGEEASEEHGSMAAENEVLPHAHPDTPTYLPIPNAYDLLDPRLHTRPSTPIDNEVLSHAHPDTPTYSAIPNAHDALNTRPDTRPSTPTSSYQALYEQVSPPQSPLQIYEDPCRKDEIVTRAPYNKDLVQALAELDANFERHRIATPERLSPERLENRATWRKAQESENRKSGNLDLPADMINNYKTIDSCIRAIRAKVMDNYGFRALQKLIRINDIRIWGDQVRFDALLFAIIEYLEQPKPSVDVSTQLMITLRVMLHNHHSKIDTYEPRILGALITCRRFYKATHHVVAGIEESCDDISCLTLIPIQCVEATLDTIETETHDEAGKRSVALGIYVLQLLLKRIATSKLFGPADIDSNTWRRLMQLTRTLLTDDCVQVRMLSYDYCISVYSASPVPLEIWEYLEGVSSDAKSLMQYYITRWEKSVAAGLEAPLQ